MYLGNGLKASLKYISYVLPPQPPIYFCSIQSTIGGILFFLTMSTPSTKTIAKREIRFAVHIPKNNYREDLHYIKECITYEDGSTSPNTYIVKNFQRPIWITKKAFRNHKEKKEFESLEKVHEMYSSQSDLNRTIATALEKPYIENHLNEIKSSPFLYGYDLTSTAYIKLKSLTKQKYVQSAYSLCTLDIETNPATGEIVLLTVSTPTHSHTTILSTFLHNKSTFNKTIQEALTRYLPEYSSHKFTFDVCDTEVDMIKKGFNKVHEWKPDFLVIWNMDFDIPTILGRLEKFDVRPEYILADPNIPREYKICRYRQGIKKKVTASGVVKPINPSLQWHTLQLTASFYVIDAMCVYRQLRMGGQEEPSYSLDSILNKELSKRKLTFSEADSYTGLAWHNFMRTRYPIEYIVYNIYDTLSLLELDTKTKDLAYTLPSFAGISDFSRFNSNPKKIVDALFSFCLERGLVVGTSYKAKEVKKEEDEEEEIDEDDVDNYDPLSLKNWIQTLPQHLLVADGVACLEEYPNLKTNLRLFVFDADVSSAYPSVTITCNVSKETTLTEVISIENVPELKFREHNLGIVHGNVNTLSYFENMFDTPSLMSL